MTYGIVGQRVHATERHVGDGTVVAWVRYGKYSAAALVLFDDGQFHTIELQYIQLIRNSDNPYTVQQLANNTPKDFGLVGNNG